jgi:hypothetical protein
MAKSTTKFNSTNQPKPEKKKRGKALKTVLFEVMRKNAMLGVAKNASKEIAEAAFIKYVAERAFNADDPASPAILKEFLSKMYPGLKATLEKVEFDYPSEGTPTEKAIAIESAVSSGVIPGDLGSVMMGIIRDSVVIEEGTDLKDRIAVLEKALESNE